MMENVFTNNIQRKLDQMQRAYAHQYAYPESEDDSDQDEDMNIETHQAESADEACDMSSD